MAARVHAGLLKEVAPATSLDLDGKTAPVPTVPVEPAQPAPLADGAHAAEGATPPPDGRALGSNQSPPRRVRVGAGVLVVWPTVDGRHQPETAMAVATVRRRPVHRRALTVPPRVTPAMEAVTARPGTRQLEKMERALEPSSRAGLPCAEASGANPGGSTSVVHKTQWGCETKEWYTRHYRVMCLSALGGRAWRFSVGRRRWWEPPYPFEGA